MDNNEFEKIAERITESYRNQGEAAAVAERDRINSQLAPANQQLWFQGPSGGNYLAFFLHDTTTRKELYRTTRMWVPREFWQRR